MAKKHRKHMPKKKGGARKKKAKSGVKADFLEYVDKRSEKTKKAKK